MTCVLFEEIEGEIEELEVKIDVNTAYITCDKFGGEIELN